ncbi:hypothetical protein sos41_07340 [Alphaproteobacteria bacterium SO-S41]|nr:hypothetical protein sos41_07340 [Alphaproteobacteria bacterium SO-S41]
MTLRRTILALTLLSATAGASSAFADAVGRPMPVPPAYAESHRGQAVITTSEVYELANILLALADTPPLPGLVLRDTAYFNDVEAWFGPYRDDPAVKAAAFAEPSLYQRFRDNAFRYCFDEAGKIIVCVPQGPLWESPEEDRFTPNLKAVEAFAQRSRFRDFYAAHRAFYDTEAKAYAVNADIRDMQAWLEAEFDARMSSYIVAISPLIDGFHATDSYRADTGDFAEAIMFTSSPIRFATMDPVQRAIREARTVFTEIDHNYVNPRTALYRDRLETIDWPTWVRAWPVDGYESGEAVFNEYMTWGVFLLYAKDRYDPAQFDAAVVQLVEFMEGKRGFTRFGAFANQLLAARAAAPGKPAKDLYPAMLDWMAADGK